MRDNTNNEIRVPSGAKRSSERHDLVSSLEPSSRSYKARTWLPFLTVLLCKLLNGRHSW